MLLLNSLAAITVLGIGPALATENTVVGGSPQLEDPCDLAADDIVLLSSARQGKQFLGLFELRLNTFADNGDAFIVSGTRGEKGFHVEVPEATFEFRDLSSTWRELLYIPGTYSAPPDRIEVRHGGGKARISVTLPSPSFAAEAMEWRLILRSADNKQCLRSIPFQVVQHRGPVKGFLTKPVPERLNPDRKVSKERAVCGQSITPDHAPSAASDAASPSSARPHTPRCAAHRP